MGVGGAYRPSASWIGWPWPASEKDWMIAVSCGWSKAYVSMLDRASMCLHDAIDNPAIAVARSKNSDAKTALAAGIERAYPVMARVIKRRLGQRDVVLDCLHVIAAGLDFFEGAYNEIEP